MVWISLNFQHDLGVRQFELLVYYGRDKSGMGYALPVLFEAISKVGMDRVIIPKPEGK
jgi:hypothetical protein